MMFMGVYSKGLSIVLKTGCSSPLSLAPGTGAKGTISTSQRKVPKSCLASWCLDDELMVVIWFIYSYFYVIYYRHIPIFGFMIILCPSFEKKTWTWSWYMENGWIPPWLLYILGKTRLSRWAGPNFLQTKGGFFQKQQKNNMFDSKKQHVWECTWGAGCYS